MKNFYYLLYAMLLTNCADNQLFKFESKSFGIGIDSTVIHNGEVVYCYLTNLLNSPIRLSEFVIEHRPNDDIIGIEVSGGSFFNSRQKISNIIITDDLFISAKDRKIIPISIKVRKTTDVILVFSKEGEPCQEVVISVVLTN